MKQAFLVSDEDIRTLKHEPWLFEFTGPVLFLHESILKKLQDDNATAATAIGDGATVMGRLQCPICNNGRIYANKATLCMHLLRTHGIKGGAGKLSRGEIALPPANPLLAPPTPTDTSNPSNTPLKCPDCDFQAFNSRSLGVHRAHIHQVYGRDHEYSKRYALKRRQENSSPKSTRGRVKGIDRPYPCPVNSCNYKAPTTRALGAHKSLQHGIRGERYEADRKSRATRLAKLAKREGASGK